MGNIFNHRIHGLQKELVVFVVHSLLPKRQLAPKVQIL
jgi:hypothetical protein